MLLEKAINIACVAHHGQVDKRGKPYILHPLAVMFDATIQSEEEMITAVLHDVVEDTYVTMQSLSVFPLNIQFAIKALSRKDGESYNKYLDRLKENQLAIKVKMADLKHNLSRSVDAVFDDSLSVVEQEKFHRLANKYRKAINRLSNKREGG